jgi:hypothetical protein
MLKQLSFVDSLTFRLYHIGPAHLQFLIQPLDPDCLFLHPEISSDEPPAPSKFETSPILSLPPTRATPRQSPATRRESRRLFRSSGAIGGSAGESAILQSSQALLLRYKASPANTHHLPLEQVATKAAFSSSAHISTVSRQSQGNCQL